MFKDFLDELIVDETRKDSEFPRLVAEATARRKLGRRLAALRERKKLSQTSIAARMGTSPSVVSRFEAGGDVKISRFSATAPQSG